MFGLRARSGRALVALAPVVAIGCHATLPRSASSEMRGAARAGGELAAEARPTAPPPVLPPAVATHSAAPAGGSSNTTNTTDAGVDRRWELTLAEARCPPEMALVASEICVDRWEATLVRVLGGGKVAPWPPYQSVKGVRGLRAVSRPGVVPQGYISGEQAERACAAAGKRLCAASEWDAACRGPRRQLFPYGRRRLEAKCNDGGRRRHPVAEVSEKLGLPEDRMWYETMAHPLINQLPDTVTKTGERTECANELGVFDMVGNLHEWIDDSEGTFRGGFFMDTRHNGDGCDYATTAHARTYHDYSTGFRCCLDADSVE